MRQELEQEIRRGDEADRLIKHPLLKEAWEAAEKSILEQMDEVSMRDTDMHTRLILARKTLNGVKRYIERVIDTGEMAKLQLREPNKVAAFFRR